MKSVLVTGGAGFIGSNFVRHLLASTDASVTVLDALTDAANRSTLDDILCQRCRLVVGNVCDEAVVDDLMSGHEIVVNFAAESHNDWALHNPAPFIQTNVLGTFNLLQAARRHGTRVHHISTDEVFGDLRIDDPGRFNESSPYRPSSPYSATKASADHLVAAWIRSFGIAATISVCSNNYGPYQHVEKFIPRQITQLICGQRPKLYGSGEHIRDWIHVDDHSAAVLAIIQSGTIGQTYLVGAEGERTNRHIVATLLELFGRDPDDFDEVRDRQGHDHRYAIDASKLRNELGWEPRHTSVEAGLAETVDWYRANESWWRSMKERAERQYGRFDPEI